MAKVVKTVNVTNLAIFDKVIDLVAEVIYELPDEQSDAYIERLNALLGEEFFTDERKIDVVNLLENYAETTEGDD